MTALVLASALTFTLPTMQARGCGAGIHPIRDELTWRVSVRVQSSAWVAMRPAMEADAGVWAALWPIVRAEAEPVVVAQGSGMPGAPVAVSVADTVAAPKWYSVASRNGRGWSCESRAVGRP